MPYTSKRKFTQKINFPGPKTDVSKDFLRYDKHLAPLYTNTVPIDVSTKEKWRIFVKSQTDKLMRLLEESDPRRDNMERSFAEYIIDKLNSLSYERIQKVINDNSAHSFTILSVTRPYRKKLFATLVFKRGPDGKLYVAYRMTRTPANNLSILSSPYKRVGIIKRIALQEYSKIKEFLQNFEKALKEHEKRKDAVNRVYKEFHMKIDQLVQQYLNKAIKEGKIFTKQKINKRGEYVTRTYVTCNGVTMDITDINKKSAWSYKSYLDKMYPELDKKMEEIYGWRNRTLSYVDKQYPAKVDLEDEIDNFLDKNQILRRFVKFCIHYPGCPYYPRTNKELISKYEYIPEYLVLKILSEMDPQGESWAKIIRDFL